MTRKKEQEQFISYITERQTHEGQMAVADFLRKYAVRYHNSDFIYGAQNETYIED